MKRKLEWIQDISKTLLNAKGTSLEEYLKHWLRPDIPLDEIGIMIFARFAHRHVAVLCNNKHWITASDNDLYKADVVLLYRGNCRFVRGISLTPEEFAARRDYLEEVRKTWLEGKHKTISLADWKPVKSTMQNNNSTMQNNNSTMQKPVDGAQVSGAVPCTKNENEAVAGVSGDCTVANKIGTIEFLGDVKDAFDVVEKTTKSKPKAKPRRSRRLKTKKKEKETKEAEKQREIRQSTRFKPRTTRNSMRTNTEIVAYNLLAASRDSKGLWKIKPHGVPVRVAKKKAIKCPETFATYTFYVKHIKENHKDYKYQCKHCPKLFNSNSWRYVHQKRHEGLRYKCPSRKCGKLFQFYYQVRDHFKKHSRRKMYVCPTRDCLKEFTTKRARKYHEQIHDLDPQVRDYVCNFKEEDGSVCGKAFQRKELMNQHRRSHAGKYVSHCGKVSNWPNSRKYHQDRCDNCKEIIAKKALEFKYVE